jgi:MFS family permease
MEMMSERNEKRFLGLHRNILFLGWVSLLTDFSSEMIYPLLPIFLTSVLGMGTTFVGAVEGVAESTASFLKLFSGTLSDRGGKRKTWVTGGYALSTLVRPLVAAATAGWHVLLIRFLDRVGKGIRTSPRDALIAESAPIHAQGKAFGFQRAMDHAGAVIGPLAAFLLLSFWTGNVRTVFWLALIPGLMALLTLSKGVHEVPLLSSRPAAKKMEWTLQPFDRRFKTFLFILVLFTLGNSSDAFLILKAQAVGIPVSHLPLLWIVLHLAKSLTATPGGMLSDRWGRKTALVAGWLVYGAVYGGLATVQTPNAVWILFGFYGLFYGLTEGAERAMVADLVAPSLRGTAYGWFHFSVGLSTLPGSLLMGLLWEKSGPSLAFGLGAALALLSALLLWILLPGRKAA